MGVEGYTSEGYCLGEGLLKLRLKHLIKASEINGSFCHILSNPDLMRSKEGACYICTSSLFINFGLPFIKA